MTTNEPTVTLTMPASAWRQIQRDLTDLYGCDIFDTEVGRNIERLYSA